MNPLMIHSISQKLHPQISLFTWAPGEAALKSLQSLTVEQGGSSAYAGKVRRRPLSVGEGL